MEAGSAPKAAVDLGGVADGAERRIQARSRRALSGLVGAWLVPLVVWMVVMVIAGLAILHGLSAERAGIEDSFEVRTEATASAVAGAVASQQELLAARAADVLADKEVSAGALRSVIFGMGFESGAVFDERGRYVSATMFREEFVGRDFTEILEHVRIAATEARPGTSQAVVSPSLGTAAVGISAPFSTQYGTRIITGVLTVQSGVLDELIVEDLALDHVQADLLDRDGAVLASAHKQPPETLTSYEQWAPEAAAALGESPSGTFTDQEGVAHFYSSAQIKGTGWSLVLSAGEDEIFAQLERERSMALGLYGGFGLLGLVVAGVSGRDLRRRRLAEERVRSLNRDLETIVERRTAQLEHALGRSRESEQAAARLARVVESAGEAIVGLDLDGTITSWNPAAEDLYGYSAEEAIGQPITLLTDPEHATEPLLLLQRVSNGESVVGHLTVRCARGGHPRQVQLSLAPIVDPDGEVVGAAALYLDVTRLMAAEREAGQAVELFETIFHNGAPQGVALLDGPFIQANDALCELLGYDRDQLLTMQVADATDAADREITRQYMQEFREGSRERIQLQKGFVHRDGHVVQVLANLTLLRNTDGAPHAVAGMLQDISALTDTQLRLSQAEQRYEQMFRSTTSPMLIIEPASGEIVDANPAAIDMYGYPRDALLSMKIQDINTLSADEIAAEMARARSRPRSPFEFRHRLATGEVIPVDVYSGPVTVNDRELLYSIIHDATARHRALDQLHQSRNRWQQLAELPEDMVYQAVHRDGELVTFEYINPAAQAILGMSPASLMADPSLVTERIPAEDLRRFRGTPDTDGTARMTFRWHRPDGETVWLEDRRVRISEVDGTDVVTGVVRDVTAHHLTEQALRDALRQQKEVADKLHRIDRMKSTFLQAVSHELRTPLTSIHGFLATLTTNGDDINEQQRRLFLERAHSNTLRLQRLLDNLLDLNRLEHGLAAMTHETADLGDLTREVIAAADLNDHPVAIDAARQPFTGDLVLVELALTNLLDNALRHTPAGTHVTIRISSDTPDAVRIVVEDDGPGLPTDLVGQLFEPFVQGPQAHADPQPGIGIGLSLTAKIATHHGGNLTAENRDSGGARLTLRLTSQTSPAAAQRSDGIDREPAPLASTE